MLQSDPKATIPVAEGSWLTVVATQGSHVHVSNYNEPDFVINRVAYNLSVHFHKWADGEWHIGAEEQREWDRVNALHMSRRDRILGTVSTAARTKAYEWLMANVPQHLTGDLEGLLVAGERVHLHNEMEKARALRNDWAEKAEKAQRDYELSCAALEDFLDEYPLQREIEERLEREEMVRVKGAPIQTPS